MDEVFRVKCYFDFNTAISCEHPFFFAFYSDVPPPYDQECAILGEVTALVYHYCMLPPSAVPNFPMSTAPPDTVSIPPHPPPPSFVSGVIKRERVHAFELMLWRACRGNVFLRQAEIEEPLDDPLSVSGDVIAVTSLKG